MGAADAQGLSVRLYQINEALPMSEPWQVKLAEVFVEAGYAIEVADGVPISEYKRKPGRPKRNGESSTRSR
jgi:hypothetical protein